MAARWDRRDDSKRSGARPPANTGPTSSKHKASGRHQARHGSKPHKGKR